MTRAIFYDRIRDSLFGGELSPSQVRGIDALLDTWARKYPDKDRRFLAYCLATAFHETNEMMQPVREAYWLSERWRKKNLRYYPWYGRGYVQITWRANYERASREIGVDLVADKDKTLDPAIAADILFDGCIDGWFTSKKLADYITPDATDYYHARRVVNALDDAGLIAGYAEEFEAALKGVQIVPPVPIPDDPGPVEPEPKHWLVRLALGLLKAIRNVGR